MFTDPQSVTINAVAHSLPRTSVGANTATYKSGDGLVSLIVRHIYGKRTRHELRTQHSKIIADPLLPDRNMAVDCSVYTVINKPAVGYSPTEAKQVVDGHLAYLTANSGAIVARLLGGES